MVALDMPLEPDFRLPDSSAIATTIALQYISRLRLPEIPVMVVQALQYLHQTFDPEHQLWESVPESVTQFPRAMWWEYPGPEKAEQYWANPSAEIIGYLYEFPGVIQNGLRDTLTRKAFEKLDNRSEPLEMHDLLCYLRLAERLPADRKTERYHPAWIRTCARWLLPLRSSGAPTDFNRSRSPLRPKRIIILFSKQQ